VREPKAKPVHARNLARAPGAAFLADFDDMLACVDFK